MISNQDLSGRSDYSVSLDSADDVRTTLAQLTARARKLISEGDDNLVSLNTRGVYEFSKRTADAIRQQAERAGVPAGGSQASVELFMARNFGFDLNEQQRLIRQLQRSQAEMAFDLTEVPQTSAGGVFPFGEGTDGVNDIDAVVENMKNRLICQAHYAVYQKEQRYIDSRSHDLLKAAWKSFYARVSDDFDSLTPSMEKTIHTFSATPLEQKMHFSAYSREWAAEVRPSNFLNFLTSDAPLAVEMNQTIATFARMVEDYPPSQWLSSFTSFSVEKSSCAGTDMAVLWATVQALLTPVLRQGTSATFLSFVSSSREVIESKFRNRMITSGMKVDPARLEELESIPAERMYSIIQGKCDRNPWVHLLSALKAGRYDVGMMITHRIGITILEEAVRGWSEVSSVERQRLTPCEALRLLYAEEATSVDPYRKAVLFVLLAGRTGESEDVVEKTLVALSTKVSSSLEDMLWFRLVNIRTQEETVSGGKVQSLAHMQRAILDDLPELIQVVQGSVPRLASFLFHAILPATGLRLLLENVATYVDGVHMTLCFNNANLLHHITSESPVDLERHLTRYCTMILLSFDRGISKERQEAGAASFSYFHKSGFTKAFAEFCQKDIICTHLFGKRTSAGCQSGALLRSMKNGSSGCKTELWRAMQMVAERAAGRNCFTTALHLLTMVAQGAAHQSATGRLHPQPSSIAVEAIAKALHIACPALSQAVYLPLQSSDARAVIVEATYVLELLQHPEYHWGDVMTSTEVETLRILLGMADVYVSAGNSQWERVLSVFFDLPFTPRLSSSDDVEPFIDAYCRASPHIVAAGGACIPIVFRAATQLLDFYSNSSNRLSGPFSVEQNSQRAEEMIAKSVSLRQQMQVVITWVRRVCSKPGQALSEVPQEVYDFEQRFCNY